MILMSFVPQFARTFILVPCRSFSFSKSRKGAIAEYPKYPDHMCRCALKNEVYTNGCYSLANKWPRVELPFLLALPAQFSLSLEFVDFIK